MDLENINLKNFYNIKLTHVSGNIFPDFLNGEAHSHEHCEIFVHITGNFSVFVEENFYEISNESIRVYSSDELHYGKFDVPQNMEWYQISIPQKFFMKNGNEPLGKCMYQRKAGTKNVFEIKNFSQIVKMFEEAFEAYRNRNALYCHYCESAVIQMLCYINEEKFKICAETHENNPLREITDVVLADFSKISSVTDLSRACNYSVSYIHRLFKENLNITPYRFITDKKLAEAKKALQSGKNITETCEYAGFENYNNFITLFKKKFNITPKKYQQMCGYQKESGIAQII